MSTKSETDGTFRDRQAKEGKKGGKQTLKIYGREHFIAMANTRWGNKPKKKSVDK